MKKMLLISIILGALVACHKDPISEPQPPQNQDTIFNISGQVVDARSQKPVNGYLLEICHLKIKNWWDDWSIVVDQSTLTDSIGYFEISCRQGNGYLLNPYNNPGYRGDSVLINGIHPESSWLFAYLIHVKDNEVYRIEVFPF